jgi:hypothetical protein
MILTCPTQVTHSIAAGWNLLGLNVQTDPSPGAEAALDDIAAQGGACSEVDRWLNGGWDAHIRDLPFNDFTLELGQGYFLKATAASSWQRTGRPPSNPLPVELFPGWNLVSFPKLLCTLTAEGLLDGIAAQGGACSEADRWLNGGWDGHIKDLPFNNFTLTDNQGYFVKCTQHSTYVPCQGTILNSEPPWPAPVELERQQPQAEPVISAVQVTNRRDVAFSVVWRTDRPGDGWVEYGLPGHLDLAAYDGRGRSTIATLHHVTVAGLNPETTYAFRVHSGSSVADQGGQPFQAVTAATTIPAPPLTAYGQVQDSDGRPAVDALVLAWLLRNDGSRSEPLSALVDGWGYWVLSLPVADCADFQLILEIIGSDGDLARLTQPACQLQPAPTLQLAPQPPTRTYVPLIRR